MFKKTCLALSVAFLVLTACSSGGGGGQTDPPIVIPAGTYKFPDTGQTRNYTSTFGEDADYIINPPSYTVYSSRKVVFDNNTRLMWEQLPTSGDHVQRTHAAAITHCEARTTGGHSDWRLPSIDELESIINFGEHSPSIDTTTFLNTQSSLYWPSTIDASNTSNAWFVNFRSGTSFKDTRTKSYYVRCVRLSPTEPTTRFSDNRDETITDQKTKLMWQQLPDVADHNTTYTWENALRHCEGLTFAGHSDWRLPNKKELFSIADRSRSAPAIDPSTFPNTKSSWYWSSTVSARSTPNALGVDFNDGSTIADNRTRTDNKHHVRCVR